MNESGEIVLIYWGVLTLIIFLISLWQAFVAYTKEDKEGGFEMVLSAVASPMTAWLLVYLIPIWLTMVLLLGVPCLVLKYLAKKYKDREVKQATGG